MALREYAGGARRTALASDITAASTTFSVTDGTGYPTGGTGSFIVALDMGLAGEEKILCSARSGNTFTVAASGRGYDQTTAAAHSQNATVDHVLAAVDAREANAHANDTTGDPHSQYLNPTRAGLLFAPIGARVAKASMSTSLTVATATWTPVDLGTERFDTSAIHDPATSSSRFTVPAGMAGKWALSAVAIWAPSSVGDFACAFAKNGTRIREVPTGFVNNTLGFSQTPSDVVVLAVGDYVELHVWHNAGVNRTLSECDVTVAYLGS